MTPQNQAILDQLSAAATTAGIALSKQKAAYDAVLAEVRELQRQADYHRNLGDNTNLQIVNTQLTAKYSVLEVEKVKLADAQKSYDTALQAYQSAAASLLTPEEKQAEIVKIQAAAANTQLETEGKMFAQKTTKYLIFGAIALVVIVVGIIIYKKKFAA